jgi:hypothetical protein
MASNHSLINPISELSKFIEEIERIIMEMVSLENSWISPFIGPWIWTSWTVMMGGRFI